MALSRFWSWMIVLSVLYIFFLLATNQLYSLNGLINGKQNDAVLITEKPVTFFQADTAFLSLIQQNKANGYSSNDTLYKLLDNGTVEMSFGKQSADGIFPTCKNTIMDIWLPLIGYLTFFCGLLNLLNDSNAMSRMAKILAPFFARIFPELPKNHPVFGVFWG